VCTRIPTINSPIRVILQIKESQYAHTLFESISKRKSQSVKNIFSPIILKPRKKYSYISKCKDLILRRETSFPSFLAPMGHVFPQAINFGIEL
jgi:Fe2+ transport system protein B